ncbi:hypothetical protein N7540_000498 [Penicillium herquei]|nr:hypothetical protein N7540_000498 [Penicillium herquei]
MFPQTEDEQIINIALVDFLNALTIHFPQANDWSIHRKSFKATFLNASFEARTDGYLEGHSKGKKVRALLEVKPMHRKTKRAPIQMQEAAQMVAWIKADPDIGGTLSRRGRRFHVSQDRHEIYIIFAEYDENHVRHLNQKFPSEAPPFLRMQEFGPWDINNKVAMKELAVILLAISLRAHADSMSE